jgi:chromosome condensin MukBEF ATPase and DNA-binding subunit MukB
MMPSSNLEGEKMSSGMPVFVKIDEYKEVLEVLDLLNKRLEKAREIIESINNLKNDEDAELEAWERELAEVEKKLGFMNQTLAEPEM